MNYQHSDGRFPDRNNPPKPRWRDALARLAAPAGRMHRYRMLTSETVDELICEHLVRHDCE